MRRAVIILAALPALAGAQWHQPLDVRNHRSADLAFLRLAPRSHVAAPGERLLSLSFVVANEFQRSGLFDEDAETLRPVILYGQGLKGGTELFVEVPIIVRGGGVLDPLIEWWHDKVINRHDPVRASTATGRAHIEFPGGGPFGSAAGFGDVTIGASRWVRHGVTARVGVKLPTGDPCRFMGSGNFDFGAAINARVALASRWTLDLNGGLVAQGTPSDLQNSRPIVYSSAIALTWEMNDRDAWTIQWSAEQSPTRTGDPWMDGDHRVLSFGYQRRVSRRSVVQIYFSENGDFLRFPGGPTVGPDLAVGARLIRVF